MKPIKALLVLAIVLSPALASAQGYYGRGGQGAGYREPGGFHHRMGRITYGGSLGIGFMSDNGNGLSCDNCGNYNPIAVEGDFHIGGFVAPRFALLFEGQFNAQTVHLDQGNGNGDSYVFNSAFMVAGQYWLTPMFWVKGGIGVAHLTVDDAYTSQDIGSGLAVMGAAGFELVSTRFFALDLQGRIISSNYDGISDHITSGTVGIGLNWY